MIVQYAKMEISQAVRTYVIYAQKNVHAIDSCSVPVGEEGYGQKRMCKICQKTNNIQNIIASREVEDWRGLATTQETQSRGRYLQGKCIENEFLLEKNVRYQ